MDRLDTAAASAASAVARLASELSAGITARIVLKPGCDTRTVAMPSRSAISALGLRPAAFSTQTYAPANGRPFRRTRTFAVSPACASKPSSRGAICKPLLAAGAVALGLAGDEIAAAQNGSRAPQNSSAITRRGVDVNARCMARTSLKRLNVERCCWAAWSGRCPCEAVKDSAWNKDHGRAFRGWAQQEGGLGCAEVAVRSRVAGVARCGLRAGVAQEQRFDRVDIQTACVKAGHDAAPAEHAEPGLKIAGA